MQVSSRCQEVHIIIRVIALQGCGRGMLPFCKVGAERAVLHEFKNVQDFCLRPSLFNGQGPELL